MELLPANPWAFLKSLWSAPIPGYSAGVRSLTNEMAGVPRPFMESVHLHATEVQEGTLGFLPIASALRLVGQGDRAPDVYDYILVALAVVPPVGKWGKAGHATYRYTVPFTAQGFKAWRVYMKVAVTGDLRAAISFFGYRMVRLGFGKPQTWTRIFARLPTSVPRIGGFLYTRYIGTRLILLERVITLLARSVPTHAAWLWVRIARLLEAYAANGLLELFGFELERLLELIMPFVLPEIEGMKLLWREVEPAVDFWRHEIGKNVPLRPWVRTGEDVGPAHFESVVHPEVDMKTTQEERKAAFKAAASAGHAAGKPKSKAYKIAFRAAYAEAIGRTRGRKKRRVSGATRATRAIVPGSFLYAELTGDFSLGGTGTGAGRGR